MSIFRRSGTQARLLRVALAGLALGGLTAFTEPPVSPEHTLRYTRERGGSCTVMIPYYGPQNLWIGRFAGARPLDVSAERVFDDVRSGESCFFLEEDCRRWVTAIRSVYSLGAGFAYCQSLAGGAVNRGARGVIKP
jgi:hypothetical protein